MTSTRLDSVVAFELTSDQEDELEAIEGMYGSAMQRSSSNCISIRVPPVLEDEDSRSLLLIIALVEEYPHSVPLIELQDTRQFGPGEVRRILQSLREKAVELVGEEMIFELISACQEFVENPLGSALSKRSEDPLSDQLASTRNEEEHEVTRFDDSARRIRALSEGGTPVTRENFVTWKIQFDLEVEEQRKLREAERIAARAGRLTGREHFQNRAKGGHGDEEELDVYEDPSEDCGDEDILVDGVASSSLASSSHE